MKYANIASEKNAERYNDETGDTHNNHCVLNG
jgi:hypothetical protein